MPPLTKLERAPDAVVSIWRASTGTVSSVWEAGDGKITRQVEPTYSEMDYWAWFRQNETVNGWRRAHLQPGLSEADKPRFVATWVAGAVKHLPAFMQVHEWKGLPPPPGQGRRFVELELNKDQTAKLQVTHSDLTPDDYNQYQKEGQPARPQSIPDDYLFYAMRLERVFTNGEQEIRPNEIGDVAMWENGQRSTPKFRAVIQEAGDRPVDVELNQGDFAINGRGELSTTKDLDSTNTNLAGQRVKYRIVDNMATKVSER